MKNSNQCACGYSFDIKDLRGAPVEFRQQGDSVPFPYMKVKCPDCGKEHWAYYRHSRKFWSRHTLSSFDQDVLSLPYNFGQYSNSDNHHKGKFAKRDENGEPQHLGYYKISVIPCGSPNEGTPFDGDSDPIMHWIDV